MLCGLRIDKSGRLVVMKGSGLVSETVQGPSLPLESVDNIEGGDGLPL
jgi:hypothetical protein